MNQNKKFAEAGTIRQLKKYGIEVSSFILFELNETVKKEGTETKNSNRQIQVVNYLYAALFILPSLCPQISDKNDTLPTTYHGKTKKNCVDKHMKYSTTCLFIEYY